MTIKQTIIDELNKMDGGDREKAHVEADRLLLAFLQYEGHEDLVAAWTSARKRVGFWYA